MSPAPLVAIVPVKDLDLAKSRLDPVLSPDERRMLVLELLDRTLETIAASMMVPSTIVVGPSQELGQMATRHQSRLRNVMWLPEERPGYNQALAQARDLVVGRLGGGAILALAADLPLLSVEDVSALAKLADDPGIVAVAPDLRGEGTNAMAGWGLRDLPFAYGPGSYRRHLAAIAALGLEARTYEAGGTAIDLDTPDDYWSFGQLPKRLLDLEWEALWRGG